MIIKITKEMIMEVPVVPCKEQYCEGMVTEDNKKKKNTYDIISG